MRRFAIPALSLCLAILAACQPQRDSDAVAPVEAAAAAETSAPTGPLLIDCESADAWITENESPFAAVSEHATHGRSALRVNFLNKPEWPTVITRDFPHDWSGFRYLLFDLFLEGEAPAQMGMWVRDGKKQKSVKDFTAGPGANTIAIDLDELQQTGGLDRSAVTTLCLYKSCPQEIVVYYDNVRLATERPTIGGPPVMTPPTELLANGGFEQAAGADRTRGLFASWTMRRWSGPSFAGAGTIAHHAGAVSAMLDGRGPCRIGYCSPLIAVASPTKLKLTGYMQASELAAGAEGRTAQAVVVNNIEEPLAHAAIAFPAGSCAWKRFELVFDVPGGCRQVQVQLVLSGKGRVWFDDIGLAGVALATPIGSQVSDAAAGEGAYDPPIRTESPELLAKKAGAERALADLRALVAAAKARGLETRADEIPLLLADLAFTVRWDLPDHLALRDGYVDEIVARSDAAARHLTEVMAGRAPDLAIPPHPDFSKLKLDGRYFREGAEPRILFSMQYHSSGELMKWFSPEGYSGWISAVGASRYDFHESPIWPVYQADPATHRLYDDSWCGHIIRDKDSAGGTDRCVINLDHPRMRQAIAESIANMCAPFAKRGLPLFLNLGFEYSYVDYSAWSAEKFRGWLAAKYHGIAELNAIWKTTYADFAAIEVPSFDSGKPETNSARYYDWGDFNLWRFTDFMAWAKAEVRKHHPAATTTTGGGEPFGAGFWRQGLDEEGLFNAGVTDIFLSETGSRALGVTSVMDLQRSLAGRPALILDPEYHARGNTCSLMFFHGCGVMDYWWWPDQADDFYDSSLKHSPVRPLSEVATVLQTALDVRRLTKFIAPFPDAPAEIALLYSRASLIQKFPGATGDKTPYSFEVERTYEAAVRLDAPVGFVSSHQVLAGIPAACKIIVIPGCRFIEDGVVARLTEWISRGGTLVVTPSSLVADEYGRKRDYLARLGLEVISEEVPEFLAGPAKRGIEQTGELDFIQGVVVKTIVTKAPTRAIAPAAESLLADPPEPVSAAGVIQTVKPDAQWTVEASYAGDAGAGAPALLSRSLGAGRVYYLAAQLSLPSQRCFFDRLMDRVGCLRPIRALAPTGGAPAGVESRTVAFDGGLLTYLINTTDAAVPVTLTAKEPINDLWNLSAEVAEPSTTLTLAPYETRILRSKPAPAQR